jgi:hypothetical protein
MTAGFEPRPAASVTVPVVLPHTAAGEPAWTSAHGPAQQLLPWGCGCSAASGADAVRAGVRVDKTRGLLLQALSCPGTAAEVPTPAPVLLHSAGSDAELQSSLLRVCALSEALSGAWEPTPRLLRCCIWLAGSLLLMVVVFVFGPFALPPRCRFEFLPSLKE